jgi:LAO/AO transport system kinase
MVELPSTPAGGEPAPTWETPIYRTVATEGAGVSELAAAIQRHRYYLTSSGGWERREHARLQHELDTILQFALIARWRDSIPAGRYQEVLDRLVSRRLSPHQAVAALLDGDFAP